MAFTYNVTTNRGRVRLRINDTDAANPVFDDAELDAFLAAEPDWRLAAALALDTIATNEALVLKIIRTLDLQTDGARLAKELREQAETIRDQVDDDGSFAIAAGPRRHPWI